MSRPQREPELRPEVRWGVGCLMGGAAVLGLLALVLIVAFALSPPAWVQVALGVLLVAGGVVFAWLVASALGQGKVGDGPRGIVGMGRGAGRKGAGDRRRGP